MAPTHSPLRPFRFGLQVRGDSGANDLRATAVAAEHVGFDVLSTFDHVGTDWSPLTPLTAMALATERIRICPLVLNIEFWHPVHLARDVAAIDHVSGGRFELGIGAGHAHTEYAAIGATFDPPRIRKQRMAEAIEILRHLLDGEEVTHHGTHYSLDAVRTMPSQQEHLPFLVGVNGREALAHAARHADTIGLMMLGRTLPDGNQHEVRWQPERLDTTIEYIVEQAAGRTLELNALVQRVIITDDREAAAAEFVAAVPSLTLADALATPFVLFGTHAEIASQIVKARERWGISYFTVRELDAFAPVIERLAGQ
ncbi:MAG: TIGR03621 family F420-dependent LLM class oxidoreductase [Ilumatobacteraceae bacterium]